MEKFNKFRRRIRPELADEIMRLYMRDTFGFEGDPLEVSAEEEARGKAIAEEYGRTHPGVTVEQTIWAIDQQIQLWEDSAIKMGKNLLSLKEHLTPEGYLESLGRIGRRIKISGELADAYILACKEDRQKG